MNIQPAVRIVLTALAAGLGAAATQIDNETLRIIAAVLVPTLAAIGIVPPQVPTKTIVTKDGERGYGLVELVIAVLVILILVFVLLRVA